MKDGSGDRRPIPERPVERSGRKRLPRTDEGIVQSGSDVPSGRTADENRMAFNTEKLVEAYGAEWNLQKPERAILESLRDRLADMRMLDIGVGRGRTTAHFGPLVKEYTGIDYAPKMIEACRQQFRYAKVPFRFEVGDARDLHVFGDGVFDFILFSFNGLDAMTHEDRLASFREVQRVGRRGGYFSFSSHNLDAPMKPFSLRQDRAFSGIPLWVLRRIIFILRNREALGRIQAEDHIIFHDTADGSRFLYYYIRPEAQVKQLRELGFHDIQLFSREGEEILEGSGTRSPLPDAWIYYLCSM